MRFFELVESKINFTMPNFDYEWGEANRYPEYRKLGKEGWIELAKMLTVTV